MYERSMIVQSPVLFLSQARNAGYPCSVKKFLWMISNLSLNFFGEVVRIWAITKSGVIVVVRATHYQTKISSMIECQ